MKNIFGVVAGVLFFIAYLPYVVQIVRKKTVPSIVTWTIWAILDSIAMGTSTFNEQSFGVVIGVWIVVVFALCYGEWKIDRVDAFCIGGAVVGIELGWALQSRHAMLLMSVTLIFIASFPTFKIGWIKPEQENRLAWSIWFLSCVFALLALKAWTFADAALPLTYTVIETTMVILLFRPRLKKPFRQRHIART